MDRNRQVYLSPSLDAMRHQKISHFLFRDELNLWLLNIEGASKVEFMKRLPSGDFIVQFSLKTIEWLAKSTWNELRLPKFGGWKSRPVLNDTSTPV